MTAPDLNDVLDRLEQTNDALARTSAELHDERLWRRRLRNVLIVGGIALAVFFLLFGVALAYLVGVGRTNRDNGTATRCTQTFIVSLLNDPQVRANIRAGRPVTDPCQAQK